MRPETALTAFCMTTVMLIVGLVILTSFQLNAVPSISGNSYIGIPFKGQLPQKNVPINWVAVDASSPTCYQEGIDACRRSNAGINFARCTDQAASDCGLPYAQATGCFLPAGFELKYRTKRECHYGVIDECNIRCAPKSVRNCVARAKSRCELIGGHFQYIYQRTRKYEYPGQGLQLR